MPKGRINIFGRIAHWFTYQPWLKAIALILAIIVWLYVRGEIGR